MPAQLQAKEGQPEPIWGFGKNTDKFKSGFGAEGSSIVKKNSSTKYADAQYSSKSQAVAQQRSPGKQTSIRQAAITGGAGGKSGKGGNRTEERVEYEETVVEHKPRQFQMTKQNTVFEKDNSSGAGG